MESWARVLTVVSTCVISLVRIKFLKLTQDYTWDNAEPAGWSVGEICSGITCACLPTLRPLASRVWPAMRTHLSPSAYHSHRYKDWESSRTDSTATDVTRGRTMATAADDEEAQQARAGEMVVSPDSFHFGRQDSNGMSPESFHFGGSPVSDESTAGFPIMRPQPVRTMQRVKSMVGVGKKRKNSVRDGIRVRFDIHQSEAKRPQPDAE